jgi:hypothetical protein
LRLVHRWTLNWGRVVSESAMFLSKKSKRWSPEDKFARFRESTGATLDKESTTLTIKQV